MDRAVLIACWPWAAALAALVVAARLLAAAGGARLRLARLREIHRCEAGSVQSLSFVLTLPAFVMVMMLIVQVSQAMIAVVVVHYAAYAAARSAIVWVPAHAGEPESENRIGSFVPLPAETGPYDARYRVTPEGPKYHKIQQAAVLACLPLAPSRDVGFRVAPADQAAAAAVIAVYRGLDRESAENARIAARLANKLAYSAANTEIEIEFVHRMGPPGEWRDPPLGLRYDLPHDRDEFHANEMGWQDPITVRVTHHLALLPGPGRLLARAASPRDAISAHVQRRGAVYVWPITASATLGNEGDKPLKSYRQEEVLPR